MEAQNDQQAAAPAEQIEAGLESWTAEERAWLKTVPEALQNVAKSRGKMLFCITMQSGTAQTAVNVLANIRGRESRRYVVPHLQRLVYVLDDMTKSLLAAHGFTVQDMIECRKELEIAFSLANGGKQTQPGERVSKGGIILNS